ncbi:MAG TPA: transposase family protein [Gemmatimonadales bacterium]|nr:transposase family protein [Gemmatimonadales bacterium]
MNVPQDVLEHKTLMIALLACAKVVARELALDVTMPVAAMARALGANRTSVYQQQDRLVGALTELAAARPGRPAAGSEPQASCPGAEMALTVRGLEFRLAHLDAVVEHGHQTSYSPSFRRFVLGELDGWDGTAADFAQACRVPADTLKDWVQGDRAGLASTPPARPRPSVPVDASATTRSIVADFEAWEGATKTFLRVAGERYGLTPGQVVRVLRICGAIAPRRRRAFRHRGTTERRSPGALLETDGKTLDVLLTGSGRRTHRNWQGIVDQATGCDTAAVVTREESAGAARRALAESVAFLGGVPPTGLLCDNKPCYQEEDFRREVQAAGTVLVSATPGRPENKATVEGAFSLFEARVGTIRLDDSSTDTLVDSAVSEIVRAYTAATNAVPRVELNGLSRQAAVRTARPSLDRQAADRAFIRRLAQRHERERHSNWREKVKPVSRRLLATVFARLGLEDRDPEGKLQEYLSIYEPAAIRQAAAIVAVRLDRGELERTYAHRYLTKVIQSTQESLDLERAELELLELCRAQAQDWVSMEQAEYEELQRESNPATLACALAERAALGGLPVEAAFWTERLLALLDRARHLIEAVRRFLVRLYEAPVERRLSLLDRIAACKCGIA